MKRVTIGASKRTGSNLLVHSLARHPQAINANEWFNPSCNQGRDKANLLKLFPEDRGFEGFDQLLTESTVIFLYRLDRNAQKRSWAKACETGHWIIGGPIQPAPTPENMDYLIDLAEDIFWPRASLSISYEYLIRNWDAAISRILEVIGWEPMPLQMATKKQS